MDNSEFYPGLVPVARREQLARLIAECDRDPQALAAKLTELARPPPAAETDDLRTSVAASVLLDLVQQGWTVSVSAGRFYAVPPDIATDTEESAEQIKARIREGLQQASNRQLATSAVQEFLTSMERVRDFGGKPVSIATLIDDGAELATIFEQIGNEPNLSSRERQLSKIIKPRVQICGAGDRCEHTGLALLDVWRYFRHTWTLEYNSVPGRTLRVLIRNDGRPNSPVMGIAMIASPAANLYSRDEWIGWRLNDLPSHLVTRRMEPELVTKILLETVDAAIDDIRTDDLLTQSELAAPSDTVLFRLGQIAARAEARRKTDLSRADAEAADEVGLIDIRSLDKSDIADTHWRRLSETALFTKKRAEQLIPLLQARRYFETAGLRKAPKSALYEALVDRAGRAAVGVALNELRKRKLATEVADISVCGAIAPYNELLGGKLVALLMASAEVRNAYRSRYEGQVSEIASQIAGRAVVRSADLKMITTTSLYGIGTSQYNRLKLPQYVDIGLPSGLTWHELRPSDGVTVTHLSKYTVDLMRKLGIAVYGRRRINSVFGEGSSPRTRQVKEGLNLIGINHDRVLKHSVGRKVFACEMYKGAIDDLSGFRKRAGPTRSLSANAISRGWLRRWILARSCRPETLERLRATPRSAVSDGLKGRAAVGALEGETALEMGLNGATDEGLEPAAA